jgi:hypothetical protein
VALLSKRSGNGEHEDSGATGARSAAPDAPAGDRPVAEKPVADEPAAGQHADPPAAKPADKPVDKPVDKPADKKEPRRAARKDEGATRRSGEAVAKLRTRLAQVVWLLFVVAALFLAVGALCIALGANKDNGAVSFVLDGAKFFDLDIFSRSNGIKTFGGDNAATKNALFNWGIGAVLYLVVGRILERIIRP